MPGLPRTAGRFAAGGVPVAALHVAAVLPDAAALPGPVFSPAAVLRSLAALPRPVLSPAAVLPRPVLSPAAVLPSLATLPARGAGGTPGPLAGPGAAGVTRLSPAGMASRPGPWASRGMCSTQPGRIRLAMVSREPSGWIRPEFSSKISRYRRPSPRYFCAISHKLSWNRPTGGFTT